MKHLKIFLLAAVPLLLAGAVSGCADPVEKNRPNVLFILLDTLRKDRLRLYGYERQTSETMDSLAEQGWVFENHIAPASQTVPSTLSLMLARSPAEHGFVHREHKQFSNQRPIYPEEFLFLAEVFRDAGYETAGFVSNPFLGKENQFDQGFDTFHHWSGKGEREAEMIADRAIEWIDRRPQSQENPFFCYLHFLDIHQPYIHPEQYMQRFPLPGEGRLLRQQGLIKKYRPEDLEYTSTSYDAGIPYVDDQIQRVIQRLNEQGLMNNTILVMTSDHGEEFMEHGGLGHGTTVYGELVRVPLIIAYPPQLAPGRRVDHLSRHEDLGPTLLELAGIDRPEEFMGRNITSEPTPLAFSENGPWRAVYTGDRKLVLHTETGHSELFSREDELDQTPIDEPETSRRLLKELARYIELGSRNERIKSAPGGEWTEEELENLRSLGY